MSERTIIAKHTTGSKTTHNRDGKFTRCWRLWNDGVVERTNTRSKYQPRYECEAVPKPLVEAAAAAGVEIQPGRPGGGDWRAKPRKPAASVKTVPFRANATEAEAEAIRAAAESAGKTVAEYLIDSAMGR